MLELEVAESVTALGHLAASQAVSTDAKRADRGQINMSSLVLHPSSSPGMGHIWACSRHQGWQGQQLGGQQQRWEAGLGQQGGSWVRGMATRLARAAQAGCPGVQQEACGGRGNRGGRISQEGGNRGPNSESSVQEARRGLSGGRGLWVPQKELRQWPLVLALTEGTAHPALPALVTRCPRAVPTS